MGKGRSRRMNRLGGLSKGNKYGDGRHVFGEEIVFEQHCRVVVGVGMGSVWPRTGELDSAWE